MSTKIEIEGPDGLVVKVDGKPTGPAPALTFWGRCARVLRWFGKTTLGIITSTAFVTVVTGAMIGYVVTDRQRSNADRLERSKAAEAARAELIDSTTKMLTVRHTYSTIVRSAMREHRGKDSYVDARWLEYQKTYADSQWQLYKFRSSARVFLGKDLSEKFILVLERIIFPSLGRVDKCLTEHYFAYAIRKEPASCHMQHDGLDWAVGDELALLRSCIYSFEIELADSIRIENHFRMLPKARRKLLGSAIDCENKPFWVCRRQKNLADVEAKLEEACASLDKIRYSAPPQFRPTAVDEDQLELRPAWWDGQYVASMTSLP